MKPIKTRCNFRYPSAFLTLLLCAACATVTRESEHGPTLRQAWEETRHALPFDQYTNTVAKAVEEYKQQTPDAFVLAETWIQQTNAQLEEFYKVDPERREPPLGIESYQVFVGMPKETVRILYGEPTRVREGGNELEADEAWIYQYAFPRWVYFIKDGKVIGILLTYIATP